MPNERAIRPLLMVGTAACVALVALVAPLSALLAPAVLWSVPFAGAFVAGLVAVRALPDNLAARRLLAFGTAGVVWMVASDALALLYDDRGAVAGFAWLNAGVQMLGMTMVAALIALLAVYPDGAYQRPAERTIVRGFAAVGLGAPLVLLVAAEHVVPAWVLEWGAETDAFPPVGDVTGPLDVGALGWLAGPPRLILDSALGLFPLAAAGLLAVRYRRFSEEARARIRWPFHATLLLQLIPVGDLLVSAGVIPMIVNDAIEVTILLVLPAALVIGLVRPELFDLSGVARRSAVYVVLWVAIGGAYALVAAALGVAAGGESVQIAVAVAILASLLFEPARRALIERAAHYAYGERVSGEELVRRLGALLEHTLDGDELVRGIAATAREGLGARWVRVALDGAAPVVDGEPPAGPAVLSAPLAHAGELLGTIECGPAARGRRYQGERDLLAALARQAALALTNARLASQLRARLDELAASRARIVAAEEQARRRIERDIHDGAQQELAALIARLALARNQLRRGDGGKLGATLGDLESEARQALENLRELAAGIHPSVLGDRGIVEAIEGRANRLPLGVTLEVDTDLRARRFAEAIEGAAYFIVCEFFANSLKHAAAERVTVRLCLGDDGLRLALEDDGCGFDAATALRRDGGLAGLRDRVAALDGTLAVTSAPGAGTRLEATFPARERSVA